MANISPPSGSFSIDSVSIDGFVFTLESGRQKTVEVSRDVATGEVWRARMQPAGKRAAMEQLSAMRQVTRRTTAQDVDELAIPTDDGGITLEFGHRGSGREVVLAVPDDGSVTYFLARGPGGFRTAGVIVSSAGVGNLGRWLVGADVLGVDGLEVGRSL